MRSEAREQGEAITDLQALLLVFLIGGLAFWGCTPVPGGLMVRKEIRDIRKRDVDYVLIGETADIAGFRQSGMVTAKVVISSVSCAVCFDELVNVLNKFADDTSGVRVSLVITNPDRPSAFQLRRVYGIRIPVFVTDDERLRKIGRWLGTSYIYKSTPDVNIYNLKPLRSAGNLEHFLEMTMNDDFH